MFFKSIISWRTWYLLRESSRKKLGFSKPFDLTGNTGNTHDRAKHHVQMKTKSSKENPSKMACEKASRRLRTILVKASRLSVNTAEVLTLPSARKLISRKDHWGLAVFVILMFGGGVIVALMCTTRRGCSRIEEIVSTQQGLKFCVVRHTLRISPDYRSVWVSNLFLRQF